MFRQDKVAVAATKLPFKLHDTQYEKEPREAENKGKAINASPAFFLQYLSLL